MDEIFINFDMVKFTIGKQLQWVDNGTGQPNSFAIGEVAITNSLITVSPLDYKSEPVTMKPETFFYLANTKQADEIAYTNRGKVKRQFDLLTDKPIPNFGVFVRLKPKTPQPIPTQCEICFT